MDDCNVVGVGREPSMDTPTEDFDHLKRRNMVVIERVRLNFPMKM